MAVDFNYGNNFEILVKNLDKRFTKNRDYSDIKIIAEDGLAFIDVIVSEYDKKYKFLLIMTRYDISDASSVITPNYSCYDITENNNHKILFKKEWFKNFPETGIYYSIENYISDDIERIERERSFESSEFDESRRSRKNELFGGRIGAVNATRSDAVKVIKALNVEFNSDGSHIKFDNKSSSGDFEIVGKFNCDGKEYYVRIFEDSVRRENKICIELGTGVNKVIEFVRGLRLDVDLICSEFQSILDEAGISVRDCLTPDERNRRRDREFRDRVSKW